MTNKVEFRKSNKNIKPVIYITPKGVVHVNPDFSVDEAAQAVIASINESIKRIIEAEVAKERMTCKEELHRLYDEGEALRATQAELVGALQGIVALWDHHSSAHGDGVISPLHEKARAALAKVEDDQK